MATIHCHWQWYRRAFWWWWWWGWAKSVGFYYLPAASDLISDAAVVAGGARGREGAAAAKAASDLPPPGAGTENAWGGAGSALSITQLGLGRHSGTGRRCRGWRHRRPSCRRRLQECWRVAADDRKRNLFWSKPQLDQDQDHGVSWHRKSEDFRLGHLQDQMDDNLGDDLDYRVD